MKKMFTGIIFLVLLTLHTVFLMAQALFEEHILVEDFQGATCIASADFDGDGDIDFVATSNDGHKVSWFENDGEQNFTEHIIIAGFSKAKGVTVAPIDNNSSWDVIATAKTLGKFSWFSNDGAGNFTEHPITDTTWTSADYVYAADIDGDNDQDLILVACDNNKLAWAKNDGSGNFTIYMLKEGWTKANWAVTADIDKDKDIDILATAKAGQVIWFENDGNENFTERIIWDNLPGANSVQVADFDNDGDNDIVATACGDADQVAWYENTGNFVFTEHMLKDNYNGARASKTVDLDLDGDTDILSIAWQSGIVNFWENDGSGNFTERVISNDAYDMIQVHPVDLDQDGILDILGACYASHEIRWWKGWDQFLVPDFFADNTSGHVPLTVSFTDLSYCRPPAVSWLWDFNHDGSFESSEQHPVWTFDTPGYYTVTLVVASDSLTDTIIKTDCVRVFDGESALDCNGIGSRIRCVNDSIINLTGTFTIETWIKPFGFGASGLGKIFDKTAVSFFTYQTGTFIDTDSCFAVMMNHANGTTALFNTPAGTVQLNSWQHVALTYNDATSEAHIYINGADQPLTMITPPDGPLADNETREIVLGNARTGNLAFQGSLDEVRLWTILRTPEEIRDWMGKNLPDSLANLAGYWKMNEGSGDTAFDLTGYGRNGILSDTRWAQGTHLSSIGVEEKDPEEDHSSLHMKCYPNPFSTWITIEYEVPEKSHTRLKIMDVSGKDIMILRDETEPAGHKSIALNTVGFPNGVFLCSLRINECIAIQKILHIQNP